MFCVCERERRSHDERMRVSERSSEWCFGMLSLRSDTGVHVFNTDTHFNTNTHTYTDTNTHTEHTHTHRLKHAY